MSYIKATDVLPQELLDLIQRNFHNQTKTLEELTVTPSKRKEKIAKYLSNLNSKILKNMTLWYCKMENFVEFDAFTIVSY